jgi:hypothetical protein
MYCMSFRRYTRKKNRYQVNTSVETSFPSFWKTGTMEDYCNSPTSIDMMMPHLPPDPFLSFREEENENGSGDRGHTRDIQVQPHDVILGRGKGADRHRGNQMFRGESFLSENVVPLGIYKVDASHRLVVYPEIIRSNLARYMCSKSNAEKRDIVHEIIGEIQEGHAGRFLKRGHGCWEEVSWHEKRRKVSTSLQYHQRVTLKQEEDQWKQLL